MAYVIHKYLSRGAGKFLLQYLYQEGSSEGGRRLVIVWLLDRSRVRRSCFGSYLAVALENKVLK